MDRGSVRARPILLVAPFGSARAVKGDKRLRAGRDTGKVSPTRHTGSYRATVHTMRRVAAHRAPVNPRARKRAATVAQIREVRLVDDLDGEAADETVEFG